MLDAETIQRVFQEEEAFFGQEDLFSTQIVLWAFLAQTLRDGKGVACAAAVADMATYLLQTGQRPPSGDTGDYCRARAKLKLTALQRLVREVSGQLEDQADAAWLWKGLHAKLVDGFTFTMPDTPENQAAFPQPHVQRPGVGFPLARACVVLSLATAGVCDLAVGPYEGKQTGETALLRQLLATFQPNDVVVFDRYFCSYMMLALLCRQGVHVCVRLHHCRRSDFRRGRRLGPGDHLITWTRPQRPTWMTPEQYAQIPETLTLREVQFDVTVPGRRVEDPHRRHHPDRPADVFPTRHCGFVRLSLERGTGYPLDQTNTASGPRPLQDARDGPAGTVGDPVGVQPDPQGDRHGGGGPSEAAAATGVHPGLPEYPGVLDVAGDGCLPGGPHVVHDDAGPHRGQRGGGPAGPHRTACPQTPPRSLSPHETAAGATTSRTRQDLTPYPERSCPRQCHSMLRLCSASGR